MWFARPSPLLPAAAVGFLPFSKAGSSSIVCTVHSKRGQIRPGRSIDGERPSVQQAIDQRIFNHLIEGGPNRKTALLRGVRGGAGKGESLVSPTAGTTRVPLQPGLHALPMEGVSAGHHRDRIQILEHV